QPPTFLPRTDKRYARARGHAPHAWATAVAASLARRGKAETTTCAPAASPAPTFTRVDASNAFNSRARNGARARLTRRQRVDFAQGSRARARDGTYRAPPHAKWKATRVSRA